MTCPARLAAGSLVQPCWRCPTATWCSATAGCSGAIASTNSAIGGQAGDNLTVDAVSNGDYVVSDPSWANRSAASAGAVRFCPGSTGCSGPFTTGNSLVGSQAGDSIGYNGITALSTGNYVVASRLWDDGTVVNAGAATWCSGTAGCTGQVSAGNSLVGSNANDSVGSDGVRALYNGYYIVDSPAWANGGASGAGAVTWCNGAAGCTGAVSASNSLVGSQANDSIGSDGILLLGSGSFAVRSSSWNNGALTGAGAVTWCSGAAGCRGPVSTGNSLVGGAANDAVGSSAGGMAFLALKNGNYVFSSLYQAPTGGAVTIGYGSAPIPNGPVGSANSVTSSVSPLNIFTYDTANDQLIVGRPNENLVSFFKPTFSSLYIPAIRR